MKSPFTRSDSGQAATEFAISSIMLLLLVSGIVDFGRAYFYNVSMHGSAREGARHAAWFDPGTDSNPFLDDVDVLCAVNQNLAGSGFQATFPDGAQPACPTAGDDSGYTGEHTVCPATGNSFNNPPLQSTAYPGSLNQSSFTTSPPRNANSTIPAIAAGTIQNSFFFPGLIVSPSLSRKFVVHRLQPRAQAQHRVSFAREQRVDAHAGLSGHLLKAASF